MPRKLYIITGNIVIWRSNSENFSRCKTTWISGFLYILACRALNCSFSSSRVWPICTVMPSGLEKLPHQAANKLNRLRLRTRDSSVAQDSTKRNERAISCSRRRMRGQSCGDDSSSRGLARLTWEVLNHLAYEIAKVRLYFPYAQVVLVRLRH